MHLLVDIDIHGNQISSYYRKEYKKEIERILKNSRSNVLSLIFLKFINKSISIIKSILHILTETRYRLFNYPEYIVYDIENHKFYLKKRKKKVNKIFSKNEY